MSTPRFTSRVRRSLLALGAVLAVAGAAGAGSAWATSVTPWALTDAHPQGVVLDAAGNLYTANYNADTVTKVAPDGTTTTPWGGGPVGDGPYDIAIAPDGTLYTANADDDTVSRITPDGTITAAWAQLAAGSGAYGIMVGPGGDVYTANSGNATVSKITPDGVVVAAFGTTGTDPEAITQDSAGNIYTANYSSSTVSKITPQGTSTAAWVTLPTSTGPEGITIDAADNLYTAGYNYGQINKITPDGTVSLMATLVSEPWGITIDAAGNLYTADNYNPVTFPDGTVTKVAPDGTTTDMGLTGAGAYDLVLDSTGNLFVTNSNGNFSSGDSVTKIIPGGGTPDIPPPPPATPSAPTAVAGVASAIVSVTPNPQSARNGAPTSYVVRVSDDASKTCTITVPATSCTVAGLTPGTSYRFTAVAVLLASQTPASAPSGAVVPTAPSSDGTSGGGATPSDVSALAVRVPLGDAARGLQVSSSGTVRVPLSCPTQAVGGCDASGALTITLPASVQASLEKRDAATRVRTLARFSGFEVAAGSQRLVTLRLAPATYASLRRAGIRRIPATLDTTTRLVSGVSVDARQRVLLRILPRRVRPAVTG